MNRLRSKRCGGSRRPEGTAVAVGATAEGLWGVPLGGGSFWEFLHPISSRPEVVGGVVVGVGGGEMFALRASTGAPLWTRPVGGLRAHRGRGRRGITVATLVSSVGQASTVLAVGRDGQVLRQLETDRRLGKPAVVRG